MPEFYGTVEGFRAYHADRNNFISFDYETAEIQASLLVASEWMDAAYRKYLTGDKAGGRDQEREQPRVGQVDACHYSIAPDETPREYIYATYEIALKNLDAPGILNADYTPGKYDSVSVDGAVSVKFTKFSSVAEIQTKFARVGQIMATLISDNSVFSPLSGSSNRT